MKRRVIIVLFGMALFFSSVAYLSAQVRIYAVQARFNPLNFQLFLCISNSTSLASEGPLYSPPGGVYALAFLSNVLYGVELENVTFTNFLVTIPHEGLSIGQGSHVSDDSVGFANIEGLAVCGNEIYATSLDFGTHRTTLITIDPVTGIGSEVGEGDLDVMLVGLAYDPVNQQLFGAGIPFATTVATNLYRVNRHTGDTTLVGSMSEVIQGLTYHPVLGLIGSLEKIYRINSQTGEATLLGPTDFAQANPGVGNGLYGLASLFLPGDLLAITQVAIIGNDVRLTWRSISGVTYRIEKRPQLEGGAWTNVPGSETMADSTNAMFTHPGPLNTSCFYRVSTVISP